MSAAIVSGIATVATGDVLVTCWSAIGQFVSRFSLVPRAFPLKKRVARPTHVLRETPWGRGLSRFLRGK